MIHTLLKHIKWGVAPYCVHCKVVPELLDLYPYPDISPYFLQLHFHNLSFIRKRRSWGCFLFPFSKKYCMHTLLRSGCVRMTLYFQWYSRILIFSLFQRVKSDLVCSQVDISWRYLGNLNNLISFRQYKPY